MMRKKWNEWSWVGLLRILLIAVLIGVSVGLLLYTRHILDEIRGYQKDYATVLMDLYKVGIEEDPPGPLFDRLFTYLRENPPFSMIITDEEGTITLMNVSGFPEGLAPQDSIATILKIMRRMDRASPPLRINIEGLGTRYFHYGAPEILNKVIWLPFIEFGGIFLFILIGFLWFLHVKTAEQRSVWVGMAKETAHQLGTPLSSLGGWLELLESSPDDHLDSSIPCSKEIMVEMKKDVERLSRIASRFGQVGSSPELVPVDIRKELEDITIYFRGRLPQVGPRITINFEAEDLPLVPGNRVLLNWAFENLIKNSLAAITEDEGIITINAAVTQDGRFLQIDFKDTGCGITPLYQRKVFQPGFTSKKRGWGLGLSFVKRIVKDYHRGRIVLLESRPGDGTTFRMILPLHHKEKKHGQSTLGR